MNAALALANTEIKNIVRDSLLRTVLLTPIFLALLTRWSLPFARRMLADKGFELSSYEPLIGCFFFVLITPMMLGAVIGFTLLDERDDDTLTVLRVTPLSLRGYLSYRAVFAMIACVVLLFISMPLSSIAPPSLIPLVPIGIVAAIEAPIFGLLLLSFASNKVEGFAVMKMLNLLAIAPVASFFIESNWQLLLGIFPAYWPAKAYWLACESDQSYWLYLGVGIIYHLIVLGVLLKKFERNLYKG